MENRIFTIQTVFETIESLPLSCWIYLPSDEEWSLNSRAAVLESEEVPPEHENDPLAGVPDIARQNRLMQALPVADVQDIVANARRQNPDATLAEIFKAFLYYYDHDAFLDMS